MFRGREFIIARILGIKIAIDSSWFWIFLLITWSFSFSLLPGVIPGKQVWFYIIFGLIASFLFFLSVLVHEYFHSLVARRNGLKIEKITLFFFGGASNLPEEPTSAPVELKMAIAGPLSSFVLAGIFILISRISSSLELNTIFSTIGVVNLALAGFNLLPGFPLDGGRVLRAIVWRVWNDFDKATKVATNFGKIIAVFLMVVGVFELIFINLLSGVWLILIGIFLLRAADISYQQSLILPILKRKRVSEIMELQGEINSQNAGTFPIIDVNSTAFEALSLIASGNELVLVAEGTDVVGYITIESFRKIAI
jgi:Zn-dependent protease